MSDVSAFGSTSLDGGTSGLFTPGLNIQASNQYAENPTDEDRQLAKNYLSRFDKLKAQRSIFEIHWQNCMTYIMPRKEDVITVRQPGDSRGHDLYDSVAILANSNLASGLHSLLTNPSTPFFEFTMGDERLDSNEEVKAYLQDCRNKMLLVMNRSNFQTEVHEIYLDLGAIGTACLYTEENPDTVVHYNARAMKEVFIDENDLGLVDTRFRKFSLKPRQIVQKFGLKNTPKMVIDRLKGNDETAWEILHAVHPIGEEELGGTADKSEHIKGFTFRSVYILVEHCFFLSKSGYHEDPFATPRWTKTTGEVYGRGPGMDALPDIQMINEMKKTTLQGAQKMVNPPLGVEDDGVIGRVRLTPGGLTVVRPGSQFPKPLVPDCHIDFGFQVIDRTKADIRAAFFADLLQLAQGPQMTATEVAQRTEQALRLMGPVLGRQHFEFLAPVIDRTWAIMNRRGMFMQPPQVMQGKKFHPRYSSLIARAQRMSEGENINRAIAVVAPIVNAIPASMDVLDGDKAVRKIFDIYGVPETIMKSAREIKQIRDARAEAQAKQVKQADEQHQAEVAGKAGPAIAQLQQAATQQQQGPGGV